MGGPGSGQVRGLLPRGLGDPLTHPLGTGKPQLPIPHLAPPLTWFPLPSMPADPLRSELAAGGQAEGSLLTIC